ARCRPAPTARSSTSIAPEPACASSPQAADSGTQSPTKVVLCPGFWRMVGVGRIGQISVMRAAIIVFAVVLGCGGPETADEADQDVTARHFYTLTNAPFPGSPNVL